MFKPCDVATLCAMRDRAQRIQAMMYRRAVQAYYEGMGNGYIAKPGDTLDMCIIHNSTLSAEQGKPWPGINNSAMRRARWIVEQSYRPSRIVTQWYRRKCGLPAD